MPARARDPGRGPATADAPGSITRRAPFSDNPTVGARGQRTQQRILDAALQVFGEEGYHQTSIDRIAKRAGCSRVSFYQYFSSKEDVFRHLAGQVGRQINASTEALDPITDDHSGWSALRAWVGRYGDIYERYEPVFEAFEAAAESDEAVAGGSVRTAARYMAQLRSRLAPSSLPPRQLDPVVALLVESLTRNCYYTGILRAARPDSYPRTRTEDAVADVFHRTLFGLRPAINVHEPATRRPSVIPFDDALRALLEQAAGQPAADTGDNSGTVAALLEAGRDVLLQRGYHGTRVDDIVAAANLSHGAFYRYFDNKADFAHILATRAIRRLSGALAEIPTSAYDGANGRAALRRWLRRYNAAQSDEAAMLRVWVDAVNSDSTLGADAAPVIDWGRRQMARYLSRRGFGDPDSEALVMIAVLDAFGSRPRTAADTDAAVHVLERGLLGR
jgi:AcrR family transcriptional regulator